MCVFQQVYVFSRGGRSGRYHCTHFTDEKPKPDKDETTSLKVPSSTVAARGSQDTLSVFQAHALKDHKDTAIRNTQAVWVESSSLPPKYLLCALHVTYSISAG